MHVAVIGLGNMGSALAQRALDTGHRVTVYNRTEARAAGLVAAGATLASSPAAAAGAADAVLVVLTDDAAVEAVCLGAGGAAGALQAHAVLADVSTVSPALARRLGAEGPDGRVLDLPVLGSPSAMAAGQGRFLCGGPAGALDTIGPLLADLGASVVHCGPAGAGAVMKLVCNLLLVTGVAAMAEGIAVARTHGISDEMLRGVLGQVPVVSLSSRQRLDAVLDVGHPGWFSPALARKDVRLALDLARDGGLAVRIGPAADEMLSAVVGGDHEWPDFAAVIEALTATPPG